MKSLYRPFLLFVIAGLFFAYWLSQPPISIRPHKSIYITEWKNRTSERTRRQALSIADQMVPEIRLDLDGTRRGRRSGSGRRSSRLNCRAFPTGPTTSPPGSRYGCGCVISSRISPATKFFSRSPTNFGKKVIWSRATLSTNQDNETKALDKIIENMSQKIYQKTIAGIVRN